MLDTLADTKIFSPHARAREDADFISDTDLVPDEIQGELIGWRDAFTAGSFRIGDIANTLVLKAAENGFIVTNVRVFEAVGKFCGRAARTVRYYAETASFFPKEIRDEFDVLPFSHFVFSRSHGDKWRDVLVFATEHPEATLSELTNRYAVNEQIIREPSHDNSAQDQSYRDALYEAADMDISSISREVSQDNGRRASCLNLVGDTLSILDRLQRALPEFQAAPELVVEIDAQARILKNLVAKLTGAMV